MKIWIPKYFTCYFEVWTVV